MSFREIWKYGLLANVSVSLWGSEKRLDPEDLGLDSKHIPHKRSLGSTLLIPTVWHRKFTTLEARARRVPRRLGYVFNAPSGFFIPYKALNSFLNHIEHVTSDFNKEVKVFLDHYEKIKLEMRTTQIEDAKRAFKLYKIQHVRKDVDEDEYINSYISRIVRKYPSKKKLSTKFKIAYHLYTADIPPVSTELLDLDEHNINRVKNLQQTYKEKMIQNVHDLIDHAAYTARKRIQVSCEKLIETYELFGAYFRSNLDSLKLLMSEYDLIDIFDDVAFKKSMAMITERIFKAYTPYKISKSPIIKEQLYKDIQILHSIASKEEAIKLMAIRFKQKINL